MATSMWGSKKANDGGDGNAPESEETATSRPTSRRQHQDPERQPLLPAQPRPTQNGYLDPDDPAVSPYNLWTVRALRFFTVLFLMISFIWWILLLVSIFVSPPGMHSRGSGFFDFSYTTLTVGNLIVALLFFASPSRAMRISAAIVAGLLLVDMIIIAAVPRLRLEEGWVGIASIVWATLIALWCVMTDRVVAWGKREEEERLTGRPETRRTLKEWSAVFVASAILIIYIIITILMTATLTLRAIDSGLKMEGERYYVDGDKYEVHLACYGNQTSKHLPTVILEAGENPSEYDFEHWVYGAMTNGTIDRYCYWDRPGYAWSDNAPSPHSAGMSADALSEALARAGEEGPFIAVSAGIGSLVSRIFSARHPHDIAGIMMIDPMHEDLLHKIASPGRGFVLWGYGIISPLGITRLGGAIFQGRSAKDRVYGRNAYQGGKFIKAQLQENLVADSISKNEVASHRNIQERDVPLAIVSSGIECRKDKEWEDKQKDLTKITDELVEWAVVNKAPHEVWRTFEGRRSLDKALTKLVKAAKK
ncbi:hypothetical protein K402DRAFT_449211 [Aulographum hederae CBS 113979]|uniref:Mitochondrial integral membrane protein-like protein n=1 Tax=Aulographum hederae CBS 113979 TaxID=1176131 RepID=A0A6G1GKF5_9PEZI|nr:hypothetical protein K402DRAFT_449211 [Aulographum hederae CBS 113979]